MAVRICTTANVPLFVHDGLSLNERWSTVDETTPEHTRKALIKFHGRFVRLHPDDTDKLSDLGLALKDGKLVDIKPPLNASKAAAKADGKTK